MGKQEAMNSSLVFSFASHYLLLTPYSDFRVVNRADPVKRPVPAHACPQAVEVPHPHQ